MNYQSKGCEILGKDLYKAIAKRHNMFTKKWTIGRRKEFGKDIAFHIRMKLKNKKVNKKWKIK